jgi:NAD(P)-dependent dehydrogenase (short-subunit alcohol dehydrogenase family)
MKQVALITGGSRGIGLGIARHLAANGFDLAINGVRPEDQVDLSSLKSNFIYVRGDISSSHDRSEIISKTRQHFGQLNVLVNNAGVAPRERRDILEATEESFDEVVSTNLKGTYFLTQLAANWMIGQRKNDPNFAAMIINISSISATVASINRGEYCVSKAGLSMATQLFATRLGEFNIPVFEVRPGVIDTDMTAGAKAKYDKLIGEGLTIQKRWGYPDDVGKVVAALASGSFPYSTGQVIMVDGGLTVPRL